MIENREFVLPEDIQAVAPFVALHRLTTSYSDAHVTEFERIMTSTPVD